MVNKKKTLFNTIKHTTITMDENKIYNKNNNKNTLKSNHSS